MTAAKNAAGSLFDHLMDMNNTPEPRMPLVENLEFLNLMGVISSPCTMGCARTLHSTRIRRSIDLRRQSGASRQSLGSAVSIGTTFGWHNRQAHVTGSSQRRPRRSLKGHFDPFPPPRLNGRCPFSYPTSARASGNGKDAP